MFPLTHSRCPSKVNLVLTEVGHLKFVRDLHPYKFKPIYTIVWELNGDTHLLLLEISKTGLGELMIILGIVLIVVQVIILVLGFFIETAAVGILSLVFLALGVLLSVILD